MDDTQKQLINEQMQKIPAEVREAILASDWERTVFNIGRAHKMHIDDIDALSIETILTMIGLEHPKDFPENLQKQTGISDQTLTEIVDEINERLFSKILEALKIHYEKVSAGEIMADEEKDELHYAGVEVEENYSPKRDKKGIATLIDEKLKSEEVKKVQSYESPPIVEDKKSDPNPKIQEIKFDPYREPIE